MMGPSIEHLGGLGQSLPLSKLQLPNLYDEDERCPNPVFGWVPRADPEANDLCEGDL